MSHPIITLDTLSLHNVLCQFHLNKARKGVRASKLEVWANVSTRNGKAVAGMSGEVSWDGTKAPTSSWRSGFHSAGSGVSLTIFWDIIRTKHKKDYSINNIYGDLERKKTANGETN